MGAITPKVADACIDCTIDVVAVVSAITVATLIWVLAI